MSARGTKRKITHSALPIVRAFSSSSSSTTHPQTWHRASHVVHIGHPTCWIQHTFYCCDSYRSCNFGLDITVHGTISSHCLSNYETSILYPKYTSCFLYSVLLPTYKYVTTFFNGLISQFGSLQLAANQILVSLSAVHWVGGHFDYHMVTHP